MPPAKKPAAKRNTQKYIRNVRYVQVSVRLGSGRRIALQPRGVRGDCAPVNKDEMNDEIFLGNVGILYEVIPAAEAQEVINKQTTNQIAQHPALQQLRNAKGENYSGGVVVEEELERQATNAGTVDERGMITRYSPIGSVEHPLPEVPQSVPPEEASDWIARQKHIEGPAAGLAGQKVTIESPTTTSKENNA